MRANLDRQQSRWSLTTVGDGLDRLPAAAVVAAILFYVGLVMAVRLSLSPFLEIDEAQFMGAVDLRLVYGNSHPPLYNWLVRGALELTGWNWPLSVALVKGSLLAATHLLTFDAARRVAGVAGGVVALAAAALMPQVSWMSAHTLAHSVLVMAAAAGVVHATVLIAARPSPAAFAWLGLAAGVGALGKYNIAFLIVPLAVAVAATPAIRRSFATPAAWLAPVVFVLLAGPALVAAALHLGASTERLEKLYVESGLTGALDVPFVGFDGFLSLLLAILASAGLVLAALIVGGRRPAGEAAAVERVLTLTLFIGLALAAVGVLAADVHLVRERYLTPLLVTVPLIAALELGRWRWRGLFVAAGVAAFLAVPIGIVAMTMLDKHRFARPYQAVGDAIAAAAPAGRITVASPLPDLAVNTALALRYAGRDAVAEGDRVHPPGTVLVRLWPGHRELPEGVWDEPAGLCEAARLAPDPALRNWTRRTMPVTVRIYTAEACAPISESRARIDARVAVSPL
ncbi:glycosyltransferase family 39 protein [Acuticoccus mangrovi]|uniref:Glycosyltransferase family 39 protein n=1 Tax=Acuticoccus mangrovi TaxID=2796142 RepID=A0A934MHD4_9HYPH|nr:glycosyltransferase family 39 protein [Acuticoccus mangrovi]MBJ3776830.1 glycosyltransferase family 39 protein [Acuticoccus mangrovi]